DKADAPKMRKRLAAAGFRGWKVEVSMKDARSKARLEALIAKEIASAKIDLMAHDVDPEAVKIALARAERKARSQGVAGGEGMVKLVPILDRGCFHAACGRRPRAPREVGLRPPFAPRAHRPCKTAYRGSNEIRAIEAGRARNRGLTFVEGADRVLDRH